jgi:replicative DNA helicase
MSEFVPESALRGERVVVAPHALEAEQAVLGGLMLAPEALARIADWLHEKDFFDRRHRLIYRAIVALDERGEPCDAVTMGDWFEGQGLAEYAGGASYLIELANGTPSAANITAYAEIVREKARLRAANDIGSALARSALEPGAEAANVIAVANESLSLLLSSSLRGGLVHAKQPLVEFFRDLTESYERGDALIGLPTPWRDVNRVLMGLEPETLYVVGARPSMGKSVMGGEITTFNALAGKRPAIFSVEMAAKRVLARAIACHGRIPYRWVRKPDNCPDAEDYWSRLTATMKDLIGSRLLIDDTPALTAEQLLARARRAHQQEPLDLIVVDHIHDMAIDKNGEPRLEYGRIAQAGTTLAKELKVPVVMLAQLSRATTNRADKRPQMQDLRESGEIEQKADVILFLHREDYYDRDSHLRGLVEVIPAKGRDLDISEPIYLANRYDQQRLEDYDDVLPQAPEPAKSGWGKPARSGR